MNPERHPSRRRLRERRPVPPWEEAQRFDAVTKATGDARFLDDIPVPAGGLHAAAVRSTVPHARIERIETGAASRMDGVELILDRDHLEGSDPSTIVSGYPSPGDIQTGEQTLLATDKVRFEGDLVGLVVARDARTAREAARAVRVEYELLPSIDSYEKAVAEGAPLVHEALGTNVAYIDEFAWGDVEQGLARAEHVLEEEFFAGNAFHRPLEPATPCLVLPDGDELTVWAATHKPFDAQGAIATALGTSPDAVRVRVPYVGGGFGAKAITPAVVCTAIAAHTLRRPVKYVPDDDESFRQTGRHAIRYRAKVGASGDGAIVALDVELELDTGAYFTGARVVTHNACISAWGAYRIPHFRVRAKAVYTNKVPAASFRATGKNQTTYGVECTVDSVARHLGLTPWGVRRKNVVNRGEHVAEWWRVRGRDFVADVPPMDTDFGELIDQAMKGIGWESTAPPDAGFRSDADNDAPVLRGWGLAISLRHGAQGGGRAHAMVSIDGDGMVTVHHNAPDLGTGVYTVLRVVASEALGLPRDHIRVKHPDTSNQLAFGGTIAQRTTVQMGNAVFDACQALKAELIDVAAQAEGGHPRDWLYEAGRLGRGERWWSVEEIFRSFSGSLTLSAVGSYSYPPSEDEAFGGLDHWAPGAAAVEIEIDRDTGAIRVRRLCAVADAGRALHRLSAERQVEGGAIMGIGLALHEELRYGENGLLNGTAWKYRVPTFGDVPDDFSVVLVENGDGPGPYGAKGLAQTSLPCITPAIGNAIRDALGVHIRTAPFTPERVMAVLRELQARDGPRA